MMRHQSQRSKDRDRTTNGVRSKQPNDAHVRRHEVECLWRRASLDKQLRQAHRHARAQTLASHHDVLARLVFRNAQRTLALHEPIPRCLGIANQASLAGRSFRVAKAAVIYRYHTCGQA